MLATILSKQKIQKAIVFSLFSLSSFTIASPSFAASINLSSWDRSGDVFATPGEATLTNAFSDGTDDDVNYNVSNNDPTEVDSLETFLGLNLGSLGLDATEGSAIKKAFNVVAGDVFSFDYSFLTYDTFASDRAFVTISNSVIPLIGSSNFRYTFATSGSYNIGLGVVDVDDVSGSSILRVSRANYQSTSVPEPSLLLGFILTGGLGVMLKRKDIKKLN
jgi:hypothetical protein